MDIEIEKRLKNLTTFAREQVDSTWLGGTSKQDWLIVGLLLETLEDLLVRLCERYTPPKQFVISGFGDRTFCVEIVPNFFPEVIFGEGKDADSTSVDALVDLINQVAALMEPTDQEKRDDAEVSAAC